MKSGGCWGEIILDKSCASPVDCFRRGLDRAAPLFPDPVRVTMKWSSFQMERAFFHAVFLLEIEPEFRKNYLVQNY